jgi:hypothetical protein
MGLSAPRLTPPTWRTRVSLFFWVITLHLSGMGGHTSSIRYRQHSSRDHVTTHNTHCCATVGLPPPKFSHLMVSYEFVPNPASLKPRTSFRCQPSLPVAPVVHQCKTSHRETCAVWIRETVAKIFVLCNLHTVIEYILFICVLANFSWSKLFSETY